ncbi:MAG: chromate transporter [Eubacteriales bacterium]
MKTAPVPRPGSRLLSLFLSFLKIGAFTFGGGYAMIALIEDEFVSKKKWIGKEEFLDMAAMAESTPGPIAVNSATYIGYKTAGIAGAAAATLAVCLPAFLIIYVISLFFDRFLELSVVSAAFRGIQVCVVYLILTAGIKMYKSLDRNAFSQTVLFTVLAVMILFSLLSLRFSSILCILFSGIAGLAVYAVCRLRAGKGGRK